MARAIEAAQAYFRMFADDKDFRRAMTGIRSQLSRMAASVATTGLKMSGLGTAMAAPMLLSARSFAAAGDALQDLSEKTGISASTLSGLAFAGIGTNASLDTLAAGMKRLGRGLHGGQDIGTEFMRIADAIHATEDPVRRIAIATKAFGKSGVELVPFLAQGSAAITRMRKEAESLGVVMTDQQAALADELGDSWSKLGAVMGGLKNQIGAAIAPALLRVSELITRVVGSIAVWVRENPQLVQSIGAVSAALVVAGATLVGIAATIGILFSPIGALTVAIAGIGLAFARVANFSAMSFRAMFGNASEVFRAIRDLVMQGDIQAAFKLTITSIRLAWLEGLTYLSTKWVEFKTFMAQVFIELADEVADIWDAVVMSITKALSYVNRLIFNDMEGYKRDVAAIEKEFGDRDRAREGNKARTTEANFDAGKRDREKLIDELQRLREELKRTVNNVPEFKSELVDIDKDNILANIRGGVFESQINANKGTFEGSRLGQQFLNTGGIDEDQLKTQREILEEQRAARRALEKLERRRGLEFGA